MLNSPQRRRLSTALFCLSAAIAGLMAAVAAWSRLGPTNGLTGGRTDARLAGGRRAYVDGGFVRKVEDGVLELRSLQPEAILRIENPSEEEISIPVIVQNVNPSQVQICEMGQGSSISNTEAMARNSIGLRVNIEPESVFSLAIAPNPSESSGRFFVFGAVREGLEVLDRFIEIVAEERPDFVVGLGDIYYSANCANLAAIEERLKSVGIPFYLIPGEDELGTSTDRDQESPLRRYRPRQRFVSVFGPPDQSFEYGGRTIILLDNARRNIGHSFRWLESLALETSGAPGPILFAHHPPFPSTETQDESESEAREKDRIKLLEWMQRSGVTTAFFSHRRSYSQCQAEGIDIYVTGSCGAKMPDGAGAPHFLVVSIEDGKVSVRKRDVVASSEQEDA
jgi:hypothetical protein